MAPSSSRRRLLKLPLVAAVPLHAVVSDAGSDAGIKNLMGSASSVDASHDFDFLFGSWRVQHRRLKERLAKSTQWVEFDGTCVTQPLRGGLGNVEDNVLNLPEGSYRGVGLRSFDSKSKTWAIWWLDSRRPHVLDVPVVGGFEKGVGTFVANDTFAGKPIQVRFQWSHIAANACRWQQAFSPDAGKSWETNWVMEFVRMA